MSKVRECLICNQPMKMVKKMASHVGLSNTYRRRRFQCTVCDYSELVIADGYKDDEHEPYMANEQVKKMYKQSEDNQL
jgi:hypothetical protein